MVDEEDLASRRRLPPIKLWRVQTGELTVSIGFDGHTSLSISCICVDSTGRTMAVSTTYGAVLILDATRETTIDSPLVRRHDTAVTHVQFLDTNNVISESEDGARLVSNAAVGMAEWDNPLFQWSVRHRAKSQRVGKYMIREEGNQLLWSREAPRKISRWPSSARPQRSPAFIMTTGGSLWAAKTARFCSCGRRGWSLRRLCTSNAGCGVFVVLLWGGYRRKLRLLVSWLAGTGLLLCISVYVCISVYMCS